MKLSLNYSTSLKGTRDRKMPCKQTCTRNFGGNENLVTAVDVFSRYAFAYPVSTPSAVNAAKVIRDNMTRHAYIPTQIITDKRSVFILEVTGEAAAVLGITLKYATTKPAQTIRVLETLHARIKRTSLNMESS